MDQNGQGRSVIAVHEIDDDWVAIGTAGWDDMFFLLIHAVIGDGGRLRTVEGVEGVQWRTGWCYWMSEWLRGWMDDSCLV